MRPRDGRADGFTRAPTPAGYRDLDGDGVQDVAPEGSCCISQYGVGFTTACVRQYPGGGRSVGVLPSPFVARYHLGFGGESTDSDDCVSFISKEDCNSYGAIWSGGDDDPIGLGQMGGCPHSVAFYATTENDLDGDGVEDAAAEGDCASATARFGLGGNTLAEVTANCWEPFVARYSIQPDGENQNAFDCVLSATTDDNAAATDDNGRLTDDGRQLRARHDDELGQRRGLVLLVARPRDRLGDRRRLLGALRGHVWCESRGRRLERRERVLLPVRLRVPDGRRRPAMAI